MAEINSSVENNKGYRYIKETELCFYISVAILMYEFAFINVFVWLKELGVSLMSFDGPALQIWCLFPVCLYKWSSLAAFYSTGISCGNTFSCHPPTFFWSPYISVCSYSSVLAMQAISEQTSLIPFPGIHKPLHFCTLTKCSPAVCPAAGESCSSSLCIPKPYFFRSRMRAVLEARWIHPTSSYVPHSWHSLSF